jgi:hypothetical protein
MLTKYYNDFCRVSMSISGCLHQLLLVHKTTYYPVWMWRHVHKQWRTFLAHRTIMSTSGVRKRTRNKQESADTQHAIVSDRTRSLLLRCFFQVLTECFRYLVYVFMVWTTYADLFDLDLLFSLCVYVFVLLRICVFVLRIYASTN